MRDLLRSSTVVVATDSGPWDAPWRRRLRGAVGIALALLVVYGGASLFTLMARPPFQVAVEKACEVGGWHADQVHFAHGHYLYRFVDSVVRAELMVDTEEGRRTIHIRLRNAPFSGWSVLSLGGGPLDPGVRLSSNE